MRHPCEGGFGILANRIKKEFCDEEIKGAMYNILAWQAPGLDKLLVRFYP